MVLASSARSRVWPTRCGLLRGQLPAAGGGSRLPASPIWSRSSARYCAPRLRRRSRHCCAPIRRRRTAPCSPTTTAPPTISSSAAAAHRYARPGAGVDMPSAISRLSWPRRRRAAAVAAPARRVCRDHQAGIRRQALGPRQRRQLMQRPHVHRPLEIDDFLDRLPVVHPAPAIEFGLVGEIEADAGFVGCEPQQEPALLLPDAQRPLARGAHSAPAGGSAASARCCPAARTSAGASPTSSRSSRNSDSSADSPWRMPPCGNCQPLPPVRRPRNSWPVVAHQYDADIGPESVAVDHIAHDSPFYPAGCSGIKAMHHSDSRTSQARRATSSRRPLR